MGLSTRGFDRGRVLKREFWSFEFVECKPLKSSRKAQDGAPWEAESIGAPFPPTRTLFLPIETRDVKRQKKKAHHNDDEKDIEDENAKGTATASSQNKGVDKTSG